jgi:hypothetical protein
MHDELLKQMKAWSQVLVVVAVALASTGPAPSAQAPSAAERLNQPGPEAAMLAARVGSWDVVSSIEPTPGAAPLVTTGIVAERRMIGSYLQEIWRMASPTSGDALRMSYLYFNRVESRWQYVSLDTRFPVGIMPATSFDRGEPRRLTLFFEPLGFVGLGPDVDGKMVRSNLVLTFADDDHDSLEQYWVKSDGSGREWRATHYTYTRRK